MTGASGRSRPDPCATRTDPAVRRPRRARRCQLRALAGRARRADRTQRRRQDDAALDPCRRARASGGEIDRTDERPFGWVPQEPAIYSKLSVAENLRLFARLGSRARSRRGRRTDARRDGARRPSRRAGRAAVRAATASASTSLSAFSVTPTVLLLDEPTSSLDPLQRERLWEFILELRRRGTGVLFSTHNVFEAERYADRVLVLVDGELRFTGTPAELQQRVAAPADGERLCGARLRVRVRRVSARSRPLILASMRWLLVKDVQILKRSPLLVAMLLHLSDRDRADDRLCPLEPAGQTEGRLLQRDRPVHEPDPLRLAADRRNSYAKDLFESVQPVLRTLPSEAIEKVRDGEAAAAVIVPADVPARSRASSAQGVGTPDDRSHPQLAGSARTCIHRPGDPGHASTPSSRRSPGRCSRSRSTISSGY